jgi:uncharacterized membrane protein
VSGHSALLITNLFFALLIVLIATMFHFLPNVTRRDIFFAVTVDPAYRTTAEARRVVQRYRIAIWIHMLVGLALVWLGLVFQPPLIPTLGVLWLPIGSTLALFQARKQVLPHSVASPAQREATLAPRSAGIAAYGILQAGPFVILAAAAVYIRLVWNRIPERFPIHWGLNGEPNGWATRSLMGVYGLWFIIVLTCAGFAFFSYLILHGTRQVEAAGPGAEAEARFRRMQATILLVIEYFFALVLNGLPFSALNGHPEQPFPVGRFLAGTLVCTIILFALLIRTGQGGANLMKPSEASDKMEARTVVGDRTPDLCWKAGIFYVNPQDPALLVEKRFGIGYTLNFGRPAAWVLVAGILIGLGVLPLVIAFFSTRHH